MTNTANRECGPCTACCTVCPVEGLNKPVYTDCHHLSGKPTGPACLIYPDRPPECKSYQCSWFSGELGDKHRPDRNGVVFETTYMNSNGGSEIKVLLGLAVDPEQQDDDRWNRMSAEVAQYARHGTVVALATADSPEAQRIFGHPSDVQVWLQFLDDARHDGFSEGFSEGGGARISVNGHWETKR